MKKPAQLGENLLQIRPRKGAAKPQTEQEAHEAVEKSAGEEIKSVTPPSTTRRRRRLSDKKMQLNLKIDEPSLNRFIKLADDEGLIFGDLFKKMLDKYEDI